MEFEKHKLTFLDGYSFEAELNGNCYFPVDKEVPESELAETNVSTIKDEWEIEGIKQEKTYTNMECFNNRCWIDDLKDQNGKQYLVFREISADELKYRNLQSKIEFLAVMTDNDISE